MEATGSMKKMAEMTVQLTVQMSEQMAEQMVMMAETETTEILERS